MDVWDIQVEEDHSYVAHGFVNHNSSSEENMQNIPKKIGKPPHQYNIKRIFIATRPDFVIVNADAKAAEVRVYAAYSKDKALIKALNEGMDPHSFFASTVYNVDNVLKDVPRAQHQTVLETIGIDKEHAWDYKDFEARDTLKKTDKAYGEQLDALRKNIKRVVFGILYGAAPRKISGIVGIPEEQAQAIIRSLFNMFPSIADYIKITKEQVQRLGVVETFLGRRRHLNLTNLPNFLKGRAERQAVNFKIQNTSAEMVLDVLCATNPPIKNDFGGNMLNTVHDSLVFQIPKTYVHQMPDFINDYGVKQVAKKYPWLPVPFSWDVEVGKTYGDLMPVASYLSDNPELAKQEDDEDYIDLEIRNELAEEATAERLAS
jgi:DNA polymerase-1